MPEGDTVWRQARRLDEAIGRRLLTASDFRVPQLATVDLAGYQVLEVVSRGKHLLTRLRGADDSEWTLRSHLRMDGTWRVFAPGRRWSGRPLHTVRVVLRTEPAVAVGFHLHDLALVPRDQEQSLVGHLGPDLLGADWDSDEAVRRLVTRPDRDIGAALLDQRNLAGIGNMYKCELLFLRGVSPWTAVGGVRDLDAMVRLANRLLMENRRRAVQTTTGKPRPTENLYVYDRAGLPCRRCGTLIHAARQGGDVAEDRSTYWCPSCQPGSMPEAFTIARRRV